MKFNLMFLFCLLFIGLVSASISVNLNSPADNQNFFVNFVNFNATGVVNGSTNLVNASLWDNYGGWSQKNTTNVSPYIYSTNDSFSYGTQHSGTSGNTKLGTKIETRGTKIQLTETEWYYGGTVIVWDSDYATKLQTVSTSNKKATHNLILEKNKIYYITLGTGSSYRYSSTTTANVTSSNGHFNVLKYSSSSPNTQSFNIVSLKTTELVGDNKTIIFNNTYAKGSNVQWNMQFCDDSDSCYFASSNKTFTIDSIAPSITLNYPTSIIDYGAVGKKLEIDYTVTDDNLAFCWYNYDGINSTPVSCTSGVNNTDNITLTESKNITIYANDTVGNFATQSFNWDYMFFEEGTQFDAIVYETEIRKFEVNITTGLNILTSTGVLNYNGAEYSVVGSCLGGKCIFETTIDIPLVASGTYEERDVYWRLNLFNGTSIFNLNTTTQLQNVSRIFLEECGGSYTVQTLNFTAYREDNLTRINPFYFAGTFEFWLGSGGIKRERSILKTSTENVRLCISPSTRTFFSDAHIDYDYNDADISYTRRNYFLANSTLSNVSQSIDLLLLEAGDTTSFIIKVQDQKLSPIEGAYVYIQRFYPSDGQFRTVQVVRTDSGGESIAFYKTEDVDYKHIIVKDGVVILETSPQKVVGKTAPFTLTFTVGDVLPLPWSFYEKNPNIQASLSFNKTSEVVTFTYIDVTGTTTSGRLRVIQPSMSNSTSKVICDVNSSQSSATLTCNLKGLSGNFIAYGYIEDSSSDILNFIITTARDIMGREGLFVGFFIILVSGFAFIWNPTAGIIGINMAVIMTNLIGFISISPVFIFGMIGISFITIILLKT